ncbi:hypothetical protein WJX73_001295 [Symbiochloris irregularis]|uniref:EF-hand domain-containing protein n=1 Tax=Symbiochloris irregularis TaxID=706552 RepID=A0AAW1NQT1_9CHLO
MDWNGIAATLHPFFRPCPGALQAEARQDDLKQLFDRIDVDGNGQLDRSELQSALSELGLPCSSDYLGEMLEQYDENHDGAVDFTEFEHYVAKRRGTMERAFDKMDKDKSGTISETELLEVLKHAGVPATTADAQHMVQMLDSRNQGEVTFQDFCRYITMLPDAQVTHDNVLYCWIDSADWLHGIEYRLCNVPPKLPLQRLLAGGIAGALSRTLVAPFERLRTMMQAHGSVGLVPSARAMWQDGGFWGMFKGNSLTVAKNIPYAAVQFAMYDQAKDALLALRNKKALSQGDKVLAGCMAGFVSCLAVYPLDMLRTCASMKGVPRGFIPLVRSVVEVTGVRGLYKGIAPALVEECVTTGLGFWSYELGNQLFRQRFGRHPKPSERALIGGATACFVMTVTLPLLVVSRRLQLQGFMGRPVRYKGMVDCFQQMLKHEGFRSFYAGMLCSYLKVAPSIGATYGLYALFSQMWGMGGIRQYPHNDGETTAAKAKAA